MVALAGVIFLALGGFEHLLVYLLVRPTHPNLDEISHATSTKFPASGRLIWSEWTHWQDPDLAARIEIDRRDLEGFIRSLPRHQTGAASEIDTVRFQEADGPVERNRPKPIERGLYMEVYLERGCNRLLIDTGGANHCIIYLRRDYPTPVSSK